ncbi:hypothetical protein CUMW_157440 [Citrus unshiu]|nr:hypothetical protein CUMW_157440 [Citrus unshiu]
MAAAATTTTKLLLSDRASTLKNVPSDYIRPISDRPNLTDQAHISEGSIPLIDLQGFYGLRRSDITKQIGQACQHGGFFQDDVPGLQVLRDGNWVPVNPIPSTFIVNIGDQMQVLSNDRYKSVLHRAVVSRDKERISIPTFYCPSPDAVICPAKGLVDHDHPAVYRDFTYAEYYEKFWNRGLATECCLDMFKASSTV